jgi:hypothetical protein
VPSFSQVWRGGFVRRSGGHGGCAQLQPAGARSPAAGSAGIARRRVALRETDGSIRARRSPCALCPERAVHERRGRLEQPPRALRAAPRSRHPSGNGATGRRGARRRAHGRGRRRSRPRGPRQGRRRARASRGSRVRPAPASARRVRRPWRATVRRQQRVDVKGLGVSRDPLKPHSMFCTCSRTCSISSFSSTAACVTSSPAAFEPSVLASRFNSCIRKSSRLPI